MKKSFNNFFSNYNYRYTLFFPFLYVLIILIFRADTEYTLRNEGILYLVYQANFLSIAAGCLLILNFILFDFYRRKITRDNDSFKFFNLKENAFARKLTVNFIITTTSFFLIAFIFISLANYSKYEADDKSLKMFNLFSEDVTLCNYDEVTEVNVYLEMESRGRHNSGYATVIELKTEKDTYKLSSSGFQDDYLLIKRFLSCFESEIIKVDNTFSDETEEWKFYGYPENPEIFEEIYKPASLSQTENHKPTS